LKPLADMTLGELLEAFEGDPQSPDINYAIGRKLMALEKYKVAIEYFQTSIALKPKFPEAYLALAELFDKAGDVDAAARFRVAADKLFFEAEQQAAALRRAPEPEPQISGTPQHTAEPAMHLDSAESSCPEILSEIDTDDSYEIDITAENTEPAPRYEPTAAPRHTPAFSAEDEHVSVKRWYYRFAGEEFGPFSISELRRKAEYGDIHRETLVWRLGQRNWRMAADIPELHATLGVKRMEFPEYHEYQAPRPILDLDAQVSMAPVPAPAEPVHVEPAPEPVRVEPTPPEPIHVESAPEPDAQEALAEPAPVQEIYAPEPLAEIQTIYTTPDITFEDLLPKSQKEKKPKPPRERRKPKERKKRVKPEKEPKPTPHPRPEPAPRAQTSVFRTVLNITFILAAIAAVAMLVIQGWAWRQARNAVPPPSPRIAVQSYMDAIHRHDENAMRAALSKNSMQHTAGGASGPYAAVDFVASAAASPDMRFTILDVQQHGGQALIRGVLTAPDTPDINIEFLLFLENNTWKIHEVNERIDGALSF